MDENQINNGTQDVSEEDVEKVLRMLEEFGSSNEGRLKVRTGNDVEEGQMKRQYHYGRCDVGSPFAKGTPFDVDESWN